MAAHRGCWELPKRNSRGPRAGQRSFRRSEEHKNRQLLGDVVEAMLDEPVDENQRAWFDRLALLAAPKPTASADDMVDFIFGVCPLFVDLPCLQSVEAHAERLGPQEFEPSLLPGRALRDQIAKVERLHGSPF